MAKQEAERLLDEKSGGHHLQSQEHKQIKGKTESHSTRREKFNSYQK